MQIATRIFLIICISFIVGAAQDFDQNNALGFRFNYSDPDKYEIANITTSGTKFLDPNAIVSISGLKIGDVIKVPGDDISNAIKKLWDQGILGDIKIQITKIEGKKIYLNFELTERPRLSRFQFKGVKKSDEDDIKGKIRLIKGKVVTDALLKNTQNTIKKYYAEKGYQNALVKVQQIKDTTYSNSVVLVINITKNSKVKVRALMFEGNEAFDDKKLAKKMKKTKGRSPGKFWVSHKYNQKLYDEDKKKLIEFYNTQGYRDAKISIDSSWYFSAKKPKHKNKYLGLKLKIDEGRKYYFRNVNWTGNFVYSDNYLASVLNIKKGDVYDKDALDKKLNYNPNGQDISSLYLDDGYLFFTVDPVELVVDNDSIDIEMRIHEGTQATIDKINVSGNTKTNDHVVLREIRTIPGRKFSRSDLIRSQREIAQLGYFDPEKIDIQPVPNPQKGTVDINYNVTEKPSDQIQLSGGWGGFFGFVGTLGLVFNNFSLKNVKHFDKWDPLPAGDGQRLSVNFQANGPNFQSYSTSFTEPWLGGRKPHAFTVSFSRSVQRLGAGRLGFQSGFGSTGFLRLNSVSVSLGKRLRWPDDYFTLSHSVSYLIYELGNYNTGLLGVNNGIFNNFTVANTLSRNSIDNPTYPRRGSSITLGITLTPPYSIFNRSRDFAKETNAEKYKWVEYHKWMLDYSLFTKLAGNLVLSTRAHFGYLGAYNKQLGPGPFERFVIGGSGLTGFNFLLGSDVIGLRGYQDRFLLNSSGNTTGGVVYNKYVMELRYPISLNPMATLYGLIFAEGGNSFTAYKEYDPFSLYRVAGVGARIFMPAFGMIGLDYGLGFDEVPGAPSANNNRFTFTIGQQIR